MGYKLVISKGEKFNMLSVLSEVTPSPKLPSGQTTRAFLCRCECGIEKIVRLVHLKNLRTYSCGCAKKESCRLKKQSGTKLYNTWRGMINRVTSKSFINSNRYIERGIDVCAEWRKYSNFQKWATENGFVEGLQIDRINNDLGYSPDNCRFVTCFENNHNREVTVMIKYNDKTVSLGEIIKEKGLRDKYHQILSRIKRGWDHQKAIDTPMRTGNYKRNVQRSKV